MTLNNSHPGNDNPVSCCWTYSLKSDDALLLYGKPPHPFLKNTLLWQMRITCIQTAFSPGLFNGIFFLWLISDIKSFYVKIQIDLLSVSTCAHFMVLCCSQLSCLKWSFSRYSRGMSCSSSLPLRRNRSKHFCTEAHTGKLLTFVLGHFIF